MSKFFRKIGQRSFKMILKSSKVFKKVFVVRKDKFEQNSDSLLAFNLDSIKSKCQIRGSILFS